MIIAELNLYKPVLIGYDWGGSIALRLGIYYPSNFEYIIPFMPAYGEHESYKDELKKLKVPTMIQWVK